MEISKMNLWFIKREKKQKEISPTYLSNIHLTNAYFSCSTLHYWYYDQRAQIILVMVHHYNTERIFYIKVLPVYSISCEITSIIGIQ